MGSRVAPLLLLLAVLAAGFFSVHNLDIELHARTGEWIVEHGSVPALNVLSRLHADHPTVQDKWGFQVLAHVLFDGLGPDACIAARVALMLGLFGALWSAARRLGAGPWWALFALLVALIAARSRFTFRPDLVSLLLTAVVARAVLAARPDGRGLLWLVPLQVLWVNLHGYFITGPLVVATVGAAHLLAGRAWRAEARRFLCLAGLMALACLLNPAGVRGALHPLSILADLQAHRDFYQTAIIEFRPAFADDPHGPFDRLAFVVLCAASALLLVWDLLAGARDEGRLDGREGPGAAQRPARLSALLVAMLLGAMAVGLRRNMAPFALIAAPLVAAAASRRLPDVAAGRALPLLLCGLLVWGELSDRISVHDGLERRAGSGMSGIAYPDAGIDFIARELPDSSVFTAFSYGSTFTGRRWPRQAAATDGNTHGYPTEYLIEVMAALSGGDPLAFDRLVARDRHDVALIPLAGPLSFRLATDRDWALACVGVREAVYVRRAAVEPAWLARTDLLARWRAGETPDLPDTPRPAPLLGIPRSAVPLAELDQALLLMRAGLTERALQRARDAVRVAPDDPEPLALEGLLLLDLGRPEDGLPLLRQSLLSSRTNRLAEQARLALEGR
jgi:hypothetical protein